MVPARSTWFCIASSCLWRAEVLQFFFKLIYILGVLALRFVWAIRGARVMCNAFSTCIYWDILLYRSSIVSGVEVLLQYSWCFYTVMRCYTAIVELLAAIALGPGVALLLYKLLVRPQYICWFYFGRRHSASWGDGVPRRLGTARVWASRWLRGAGSWRGRRLCHALSLHLIRCNDAYNMPVVLSVQRGKTYYI